MGIDLSSIGAGTGGFVITGQCANDQSGVSVASARAVNGSNTQTLIGSSLTPALTVIANQGGATPGAASRPASIEHVNLTGSGNFNTAEASIADFPLMSHGQNDRRFSVVAIQHDVAAVAKIDQPFAEFGEHVLDRAADTRLQRQDLHPFADRLHRAPGGVWIPFGEKPVKALHIVQPGG